jgi:hypothetical protein
MTPGEATWIVNGSVLPPSLVCARTRPVKQRLTVSFVDHSYALTLAAFLLTGGRLADMFSVRRSA